MAQVFDEASVSVREQLSRLLERAAQRLTPEQDRPPIPPRLREELRLWLLRYPRATLDELAEFAVRHAEEAHLSGFQRGVRWQQLQQQGVSQAALEAEQLRHCYSLAGSHPAPPEPYERALAPQDALAEQVDYEGRYWGTHRVVLLDVDGRPVDK